MKPAALESHKEKAIVDIEFNLDTLLKAMGISYENQTPPVRNPSYRTLQALERINAKLALVMEATGIAPVRETEAADLSDPEPEATAEEAPEPPAEETQEAQPADEVNADAADEQAGPETENE